MLSSTIAYSLPPTPPTQHTCHPPERGRPFAAHYSAPPPCSQMCYSWAAVARASQTARRGSPHLSAWGGGGEVHLSSLPRGWGGEVHLTPLAGGGGDRPANKHWWWWWWWGRAPRTPTSTSTPALPAPTYLLLPACTLTCTCYCRTLFAPATACTCYCLPASVYLHMLLPDPAYLLLPAASYCPPALLLPTLRTCTQRSRHRGTRLMSPRQHDPAAAPPTAVATPLPPPSPPAPAPTPALLLPLPPPLPLLPRRPRRVSRCPHAPPAAASPPAACCCCCCTW